MTKIDWRQLYESNQAAISRAGLPTTATAPLLPLSGAPPASGLSGRSPAFANAARGAERVAAVRPTHRGTMTHIPSRLDPLAPAPLVCMLHGCTQNPASFAAATLMNQAADRHGFVVVYPGQERGANPQGCWNWFLPEHQGRDGGEPAAIAAVVLDLIAGHSRCTIDPARVFVAGLSSGGAMAAILAACYPDLFTAAAVHSGLAYGSARDTASAFAAMSRGGANAGAQGRAAHAAMGENARPVPTIVIHGTADRTVAPVNATQVLAQSMSANRLAAPEICHHDVAQPTASCRGAVEGGYTYTRSRWTDTRGVLMHELLNVDALGHAWSGGASGGSYTDARGPSATEAIWTFFELAASGQRLG